MANNKYRYQTPDPYRKNKDDDETGKAFIEKALSSGIFKPASQTSFSGIFDKDYKTDKEFTEAINDRISQSYAKYGYSPAFRQDLMDIDEQFKKSKYGTDSSKYNILNDISSNVYTESFLSTLQENPTLANYNSFVSLTNDKTLPFNLTQYNGNDSTAVASSIMYKNNKDFSIDTDAYAKKVFAEDEKAISDLENQKNEKTKKKQDKSLFDRVNDLGEEAGEMALQAAGILLPGKFGDNIENKFAERRAVRQEEKDKEANLGNEISALNQEIEYRKSNLYSQKMFYELSMKPDFEEKSKFIEGKTPSLDFGDDKAVRMGLVVNVPEERKKELDKLGYDNLGYTPEQKKVAYYIANTKGKDAAQEYIDNLKGMTSVNGANYLKIRDGEHIGTKMGYQALAGIESLYNIPTEIKNTFTLNTEYKTADTTTLVADMMASEAKGAEKIILGGTRGIIELAPSLAITAATGGAGAPSIIAKLGRIASKGLFAGNVYAKSYRDAVNSGNDWSTSAGFGLGSAGLELGLEQLSGITLGGTTPKVSFVGKVTSKFDDIFKSSPKLRAVASTAGRLVENFAGEFTEEYVADEFNPVLRNVFLGENNEFKVYDDEFVESGLIGGFTGAILGSPSFVTNIARTFKPGNYGANVAFYNTAFDGVLESEMFKSNNKVFEGMNKEQKSEAINRYRAEKIYEAAYDSIFGYVSQAVIEGNSVDYVFDNLKKEGIDTAKYKDEINHAYDVASASTGPSARLTAFAEKELAKGGTIGSVVKALTDDGSIIGKISEFDGLEGNELTKAVRKKVSSVQKESGFLKTVNELINKGESTYGIFDNIYERGGSFINAFRDADGEVNIDDALLTIENAQKNAIAKEIKIKDLKGSDAIKFMDDAMTRLEQKNTEYRNNAKATNNKVNAINTVSESVLNSIKTTAKADASLSDINTAVSEAIITSDFSSENFTGKLASIYTDALRSKNANAYIAVSQSGIDIPDALITYKESGTIPENVNSNAFRAIGDAFNGITESAITQVEAARTALANDVADSASEGENSVVEAENAPVEEVVSRSEEDIKDTSTVQNSYVAPDAATVTSETTNVNAKDAVVNIANNIKATYKEAIKGAVKIDDISTVITPAIVGDVSDEAVIKGLADLYVKELEKKQSQLLEILERGTGDRNTAVDTLYEYALTGAVSSGKDAKKVTKVVEPFKDIADSAMSQVRNARSAVSNATVPVTSNVQEAEVEQADVTSETVSETEKVPVENQENVARQSDVEDENFNIENLGASGKSVYNSIMSDVVNRVGTTSESNNQFVEEFKYIYSTAASGINVDASKVSKFTEDEVNRIVNAAKNDTKKVKVVKKEDAHLIKNDAFYKANVSKREERMLKAFAKLCGRDIIFSDTLKGNAQINLSTGVIEISVNAKNGTKWALIHEAFHALKADSPAEANSLQKAVIDIISKNAKSFIKTQAFFMDVYGNEIFDKDGKLKEGAEDYIKEEMVADMLGYVLSKSDVLSTITGEQRNILQKFIDKLTERFSEDYLDKAVSEDIRQAYKDLYKEVDTIAKQFKEVFDKASKETKNTVSEDGGTVDAKDGIRHSYSSIANTFFGDENMASVDFIKKNYKDTEGYKNYVEKCLDNMRQSRENFDENTAREEIEKQIDGIVRVALASKKAGYDIADNKNKRDVKDSKSRLLFSSLEPNSDYFTSSDISTICDKRKNFAEIYDEIVRIEEEKGVPEDKRFFSNVDNYFVIHKIMADMGLTQPCRQCYVESMRKNLAPMANAFLKLVNETDAGNKSNDQLYSQSGKTKGELKSNNAKLRENVLKTFDEHPEYDMTVSDLTVETLTTEEGLALLKIKAPLIYEAFNSFYGQSKPKMPKAATPFRFGELTALLTDNNGKINQRLVYKINSTGGFRLQSYSDFQIQNYVDVLQVLFEAGTLGLNGHAYTKVPAFLEATDNTNLKRNISIFMYKDEGQWKLDKNDSFPYDLEEIYKIVEADKSGNTGIIAVSQNKDMSCWIMANDMIGYGIPFHKSGLKMGVVRDTDVKTEDGRVIKGYAGTIDHTKQQTEVWAKTTDGHKALTKVSNGINIYSFWDFDNKSNLSKKELIEKNLKLYIDECEKAGYLPKFRDYVMNNGAVLSSVLSYAKELGYASKDATVEDISFNYKGYTIPYGYYKFLGDFSMFTPDGKASAQKVLSLENYDFDKAVDFFSDAESLRRNEILQQFANGEERAKYRDSKLSAEELEKIVDKKRKDIAKEVTETRKSKDLSGKENDFSLDKSAEETRDLVAFHNINEQKLLDALNRGALLMPSIAVSNIGMTDFGDISMVFEKDTINPETNASNKLYGSDAWTPTQVSMKMNPKFDNKKVSAVINVIKKTLGDNQAQLFDFNVDTFEKAIEQADGSVYHAFAENLGIQTAYSLNKGYIQKIPTNKDGTVDTEALRDDIEANLNKDQVWRAYKIWLENISNTVITSYDKATNEEILRNMKAQPDSAKKFKLSEQGDLTVPSVPYASIQKLKNNKSRLSSEADSMAKDVGADFIAWANGVSQSTGEPTSKIIKAINESFGSRYDATAIAESFIDKGITIMDTDALSLQALYKSAVELPTRYFEAKPGRAIGFEEVAMIILPSNASKQLRAELDNNNIPYTEYEAGNNDARLEALDSVQDVKFSKDLSGAEPTRITMEMSDAERTKILSTKSVVAPLYEGQADSLIETNAERLNSEKLGLVKAAIIAIGKQFDVFGKSVNIEDVDVEITLSKSNLKESVSKEVTPTQLAKLLPVLKESVSKAIGVERHDNRYYFDSDTVFFDNLLGGYIDGTDFVPIRFGLKHSLTGTTTLYVVVDQNSIPISSLEQKNKTKVVNATSSLNEKQTASRLVEYSLPHIIPFVKSKDLLRYLPDEMLNAEQKTAKWEAISETIKKTNDKNDKHYFEFIKNGNRDAAKKMVNEAAKKAGYSVKAYHGTKGTFTVFMQGHENRYDTGYLGSGFYFTDKKETAKNYSEWKKGNGEKAVMESFLNLKNPLVIKDTQKPNLIAVQEALGLQLTDFGNYFAAPNDQISNTITAEAKKQGYDGIIRYSEGYDEYTYVVFDANQIKSADPVTYDDKGNVIPLSERFDESNADIRWSKDLSGQENEYKKAVDRSKSQMYNDNTKTKPLIESKEKNNENKGKQSLFGIRWSDLFRSREQSERIFGNAGKERQESYEQRKKRSDRIRRNGRFVRRVIDGATANVILRAEYNSDMKQIYEFNKKLGINTIFTIDDIVTSSGVSVAGFVNGNGKMFISYNAETSPFIISRHESCHWMYDTAALQRIKTIIYNKMPKKLREQLYNSERYHPYWEHYNGVEADVFEEIVCDIMSGAVSSKLSYPFGKLVNAYWNKDFDVIRNFSKEDFITLEQYERGERYYNLQKQWYPDLQPDELNALRKAIKKDILTSTNSITDTANWMFTHIGDLPVFAIYSTVDTENPTLLYESKKDKAEFENQLIKKILEGQKDGKHSDGKSGVISRVLKSSWVSKSGGIIDDNGTVGRGSNNRNAGVLQNSSSSRPDAAFESVIRNLFEIQEKSSGITKKSKDLSGESKYEFSDEWEDKIDEFGAIPQGENPVREVNVPKKISKTQPVSQFARTMMEAEVTPEFAMSEFEKRILDGTMTYEVVTNKSAKRKAESTIKEDGFKQALSDWFALTKKQQVLDKESMVLGMELYNQCVTNKDVSNAMKVAAELAVFATKAGQAIQACRMLKLMSPDGQLYYIEKSVKKMNEEFREKLGKKYDNIVLDEDLMKDFLEAESEEAKKAAYDDLCQDIADQIPSTLHNKWDSWRYLAMLGNPRTHIRNVFGNAMFVPAIRIKNHLAAIGERIAKVPIEQRRRSHYKTKEAIEFAKQDFPKVKDIITSGGSKYSEINDIEERRTIFKTKWLEYLRKKNFEALELEDAIFLKSHYVDSLARIITARKLDVNKLEGQALENLRTFAIQQAAEYTYRDANALATELSRIERTMKTSKHKPVRAASLLLEGFMPFKKTPLNIAKQGIVYSPIGIMTGISKAIQSVKTDGEIAVQDAIDDISKGITGTGVVMIGYFLASLGLLSGGDEEDVKKSRFDRMVGEQSFSFNVGDHSYTVDWMAPASLPLFVGVALSDLMKDDGLTAAEVFTALGGITEPLFELSVLSGVSDAIDAAKYSQSNPAVAMLADMGISYIMQALPTIGGQLSRTIDSQKREYSYVDKNNKYIPASIQKIIGQAAGKFPGASFLFTKSVDDWGRDESYGGFVERFVENTVSPGYYSKENYTDVDNELMRLYTVTNDSAVFPPKSSKYITEGGVKHNFTAKQYEQYKRDRGQSAFNYVNKLINSDEYKNMGEKEQLKAIKKCYERAGDEAKLNYLSSNELTFGRGEDYKNLTEKQAREQGYFTQNEYEYVENELFAVMTATESTSLFPSEQSNYYTVDGEKHEMTDEQHKEATSLRYNKSMELLLKFFNDEKIQGVKSYSRCKNNDEIVDALKDIYRMAGDYTKDIMLDKVKSNKK